jgi:hypothetical protein
MTQMQYFSVRALDQRSRLLFVVGPFDSIERAKQAAERIVRSLRCNHTEIVAFRNFGKTVKRDRRYSLSIQ